MCGSVAGYVTDAIFYCHRAKKPIENERFFLLFGCGNKKEAKQDAQSWMNSACGGRLRWCRFEEWFRLYRSRLLYNSSPVKFFVYELRWTSIVQSRKVIIGRLIFACKFFCLCLKDFFAARDFWGGSWRLNKMVWTFDDLFLKSWRLL